MALLKTNPTKTVWNAVKSAWKDTVTAVTLSVLSHRALTIVVRMFWRRTVGGCLNWQFRRLLRWTWIRRRILYCRRRRGVRRCPFLCRPPWSVPCDFRWTWTRPLADRRHQPSPLSTQCKHCRRRQSSSSSFWSLSTASSAIDAGNNFFFWGGGQIWGQTQIENSVPCRLKFSKIHEF